MASATTSLASGREHVRTYRWPGGWTARVCRAPILKNSELTPSEYSTGAWRRELSLTLYAGQHLPGALYGGSSLELLHEASGVRISFHALEALRVWALLGLEPPPHLSPSAPAAEWDYSFTTDYVGATAVAPLGTGLPLQPDDASLYARPAADLASGRARLRKPLCKCRGVTGRKALIAPTSQPAPTAPPVGSHPAVDAPPPPPPDAPSQGETKDRSDSCATRPRTPTLPNLDAPEAMRC